MIKCSAAQNTFIIINNTASFSHTSRSSKNTALNSTTISIVPCTMRIIPRKTVCNIKPGANIHARFILGVFTSWVTATLPLASIDTINSNKIFY